MKKWLYLTAALAAAGILSRLPHPARDIAKLEPVRTVCLFREDEALSIETDTGDCGSGPSLRAAYSDMKSKADGEIFLDTAEFLILGPGVVITEDFYDLLRPSCKVCICETRPDLETVSGYLRIHRPEMDLAHLRWSGAQNGTERSAHAEKTE